MKLLLDQGLPFSAAAQLREQGIDALHVSEIGMAEAEDREILVKAQQEGRVVVTLDADFHACLAQDVARSPSVIRIRIERLRAGAVTTLLQTLIGLCHTELHAGAAVTVEPNRVRIRRLPFIPDV
ncbi:MAG: DUF5615 family PIN-like protein [Gloeomargaritaceae cyanobacterium C42_A2020_066]|nr:DUF5615 family PIN-like protein [Gloeomargaritaceae cyanobacterium C42_A2020_066]